MPINYMDELTNQDSDFYDEMLKWFSTFARRSLEDFHRFTRDAGLTMLQMNVMMQVHYGGPCEMNTLLETMLASKAAVSQMIERMVQQDLVERSESPDDRRARRISLTKKGHQLVEDSVSARQGWLLEIGKNLSPAQKSQIAHAIHTLAQATVIADGHIGMPDDHRHKSQDITSNTEKSSDAIHGSLPRRAVSMNFRD